jgi:transposase InsO family protein
MIIVAVDYLKKWVELRAMPNGKADMVATFFVEQIGLRHGAPESIISDRGKCFIAKLTQEVMKNLGTNHKTTSSYHSQANGLVERMNHTLAAMLSMACLMLANVDGTKTSNYMCDRMWT